MFVLLFVVVCGVFVWCVCCWSLARFVVGRSLLVAGLMCVVVVCG